MSARSLRLALGIGAGLYLGGPSGAWAQDGAPGTAALERSGAQGQVSATAPFDDGSAPERAPDVPVLAERGALRPPPRSCTFEPRLDFTSSQFRDFQVDGVSQAGVLIVGQISAKAADREVVTASLGARCSLWSGLEASLNVPYVRRGDRDDDRVVAEGTPEGIDSRMRGQGLGDAEFGLHYQFPHRTPNAPYLFGALLVKSNTGLSPFDVSRDASGAETELPTGSGYWSVEPSLTWIYPSDPAIVYGSLSYTFSPRTRIGRSFERRSWDANNVEQVTTTRLEDIDPGDALGLSFGMSLALNERLSLSLGYSHRYVLRTLTKIDGTTFESDPLHQGSLQVGAALATGRNSSAQLTLSIGVTKSAPDVRLSLRAPFTWSWISD